MAKYRKLNEPVFITKCELRGSKYGNDIYEIHLRTLTSQEDYITYADPMNVNWRTWEHIVDAASTHGVVLSKCKVKDEDKRIINADSQVKIEHIVTKEDLAKELAEYWDKLLEEKDMMRKFFTQEEK